MGDSIVGMFPNYAVSKDTNCILLLGAEPLTARPMAGKAIMEAKKRGAKMIVVDPVQTQSARMADIWLPLRPGTDSALLLGMINVIVSENLYDRGFVEKWCHGFDKLVDRLREYPLPKVASITGLPEDLIRQAAEMYARNGPACAIEGMGLEHSYTSTQALHHAVDTVVDMRKPGHRGERRRWGRRASSQHGTWNCGRGCRNRNGAR